MEQTDKPPEGKRGKPISHSLRTLLIVVAVCVVYAIGLQVTKVNLETPKEPRRQAQLANIIRGLARPRLFEYEEERLEIDAPVLMPCDPAVKLPPVDKSGRYIEVIPDCVALGQQVTVNGHGFEPGETMYLFFLPEAASIHEQIELRLADEPVDVDAEGQFSHRVNMRNDRPSEEPQTVRAVVRLRSGLPTPSQTLRDTIDKIIETVFLAFIATTLGTVLAVPISFLAARNLMTGVVSPFGSLMSGLLLAPFGWFLGSKGFGWLKVLVGGLVEDVGLGAAVAVLVVSVAVVWLVSRLLRRADEGRFAVWQQVGIGLVVVVAMVLGLASLARLGIGLGQYLKTVLGPLGFLGNALFIISDLVDIMLPVLGGLVGLFVLFSFASSLGSRILKASGDVQGRVFTVVVATLAAGLLTGILLAGIGWLYQVEHPIRFIGVPAIVVAVIVLVLSLRADVNRPVPIGAIVYNITRTVLNALRSIEPLIMVVAFAVWVGIGPFAGVMALALHTIASLGKLYSEQVENILTGPVEAVTATGANFLQTIVYAVIPQIIPSYTAFTIYRWDINVRMSTIIGFGGGGGIGFLVQQNLNLLKYRDASVQMIAIAIVVATLDYASSKIRQKIN